MKKLLTFTGTLVMILALLLTTASGDVLTGGVNSFSIPDDPVETDANGEEIVDFGTTDGNASVNTPSETNGVAAVPAEPVPITIGVSTQMSGYFFSDMWGNNTVDADIRSMLHGYGTIVWRTAGEYGVDENVVTDLSTTDGNRGRTYTITLAQDLRYNDGTPITAVDYVFSILLHSDPLLPQLGGTNTSFGHLVGWSKYADGTSNVFTGVRLLNDYSFSVTVPSQSIPYFFELTYAAVEPCPIDVIAPGFRVMDDGAGAYLALPDETTEDAAYIAAPLTLDMLRATLTAADGYLHQPKKTCGPYMLQSYDAAASTVKMVVNPNFKGNYENRIPEIDDVTVVQIDSDHAIEAFRNGDIQVLHKLTDGSAIDSARQLMTMGQATISNYLRSGYAFLAFACEQAPTDDVNVRKAIAMSIDREAIITDVLKGYGLPVYGYYGYGQWMAAQNIDELTKLEIGYNINAARALLIDAGYIYNEDGTEFVDDQGQTRCKIIDGTLTPLELRWAKTHSTVSDALLAQLEPVFASLGIRLTVHETSFSDMLNEYYRIDGERSDNLFFLSDNFFHTFDPYYTYHTDDAWQGVFNTSGLRDTELMNDAASMRKVAGDDLETYFERWMIFQQRWHEVMPTAPIYSNVYYDVCIPSLYGYTPSSQYGFGSALLYASFTPPVEEDPVVVDDLTDDELPEDEGDVIFD